MKGEPSRMVAAPEVTRETIDSWPVDRSGLPHRACNSLARAGVRTIGELRPWTDEELMNLRSLGRTSLRRIREFFELTARIERGRVTVRSIRDLLRRFLEPAMLFVVERRYGLSLAEGGDPMTLQAVGDLIGRTRERIRQVEEAAWERLDSELCRAFANEFSRQLTEWMRERGGICDTAEVEQLRRDETMAGYRPMSVMRLFARWTGEITFRERYASSMSAGDLAAVEQAVMADLDRPVPPRRPEEIAGALGSKWRPPPGIDRLRVVATILRGHPAISGTLDGRFFMASRSAQWVLLSLLRGDTSPRHYREITAEYNRHMDLRSQKGPGFILGLLNRHEAFRRADRATYVPARG